MGRNKTYIIHRAEFAIRCLVQFVIGVGVVGVVTRLEVTLMMIVWIFRIVLPG